MNTRTLIGSLVMCSAAFAAARAGLSQDAGQDAGQDAPAFDMEQMMEAMKLAQPGPEHDVLARMAGEWESEVSIRMMPGAPPTTSKATASSRMILGGRFLEVVSKGSFMGQPFESVSILGFDRRHEEWTIIGLDTLGTYWVTGKGTRGDDGVIRMHGTDDDLTGEQVFTFEFEIQDDDVHEHRIVFEKLGPQTFDPPFTMVAVRSTREQE